VCVCVWNTHPYTHTPYRPSALRKLLKGGQTLLESERKLCKYLRVVSLVKVALVLMTSKISLTRGAKCQIDPARIDWIVRSCVSDMDGQHTLLRIAGVVHHCLCTLWSGVLRRSVLNIGRKMDGDTTKVLLVTANVGSIFEEVSDNLIQKSRLLGCICRWLLACTRDYTSLFIEAWLFHALVLIAAVERSASYQLYSSS